MEKIQAVSLKIDERVQRERVEVDECVVVVSPATAEQIEVEEETPISEGDATLVVCCRGSGRHCTNA